MQGSALVRSDEEGARGRNLRSVGLQYEVPKRGHGQSDQLAADTAE